MVTVLNKCDQAAAQGAARRLAAGIPGSVIISARSGEGLDVGGIIEDIARWQSCLDRDSGPQLAPFAYLLAKAVVCRGDQL